MEDIKIRPNMKIGQLDAESDAKFLAECYVDKGLIEVLIDTSASEAIILGRTGAGKTASLLTVKEAVDKERSKLLNLEDVFLRYIDNSNIIKFLTLNNVNLDLFYKYLWRHILTVEFLKLKYPHLNDESKFSQIINELRDLIRRPEEKTALKYLEQWSDKYWIETVENIEEIVNKFSSDMKAGFEAGFLENKINAEGAQGLSEEQKVQVESRVQKIINDLQISDLSKVIDLMNRHIFNDQKKKYYLLIDKLDENWVSIEVKYGLIKSLIEEIKHFRKIENVKILVSLRLDLYQLTLEKTRSSGFQEDKLLSLIWDLSWTEKDLKEIVDKRITFLYKHKYTNRDIVFEDLFPVDNNVRNRDSWQYLITRTFWRPRDILQFVNYCLSQSVEKSLIEWSAIYKAEKEYSKDRLKSLHEEWCDIYPSLKYTIYILSNAKEIVSIDDFKAVLSEDKILQLYELFNTHKINDQISEVINNYIIGNEYQENIVYEVLSCFYRTGLIGTSDSLPDSFEWSFRHSSSKSEFECSHAKHLKIHKMFHQALHIEQ